MVELLLAGILNSRSLGGDETGWFIDGISHWVWVLATKYHTYYHISPTRSATVAQALAGNFEGITLSDSYSGWNHIGYKQQRCLLHYYRDLHRTSFKNSSSEFNIFFNILHDILDEAKRVKLGTDDELASLKYRLDNLLKQSWTDVDCVRYIKRLRREKDQLFTFLTEDIEYHNNSSERALRCISTIRKNLYGNRSRDGAYTTETLMSIYSTCKLRGINFYQFIRDYLDGKVNDIPIPINEKVM